MDQSLILKAENIKTWFPVRGHIARDGNCVKAVDGVSLSLYRGKTYGLVGETGCGKSTLGRTLIRLLEPTEGTILLDGTDITHFSPFWLQLYRARMQMVFQAPTAPWTGACTSAIF